MKNAHEKRCISVISFVTLIIVVNTYKEVIGNQAKGILAFIACVILTVGLITLMEGGVHLDIINVQVVGRPLFQVSLTIQQQLILLC